MKLIDIINSIDKNNKGLQSQPAWSDIAQAFQIHDLGCYDDKRLTAYHIVTWYCTDSYVGLRAYFLDDEFIGISEQSGRKSNEDFKFVSKEIALKVRFYLESLRAPNSYLPHGYLDLEEEVVDYYSIDFIQGILPQFHKYGICKNNEKVELVATSSRLRYDNFDIVKVKFENGEEKLVDIKDIRFKAGAVYPNAQIRNDLKLDKNGQEIS